MRSFRPLLVLPGALAALTLLPAADQGGDADRPPVPIDQGLVGIADFRQRQSIDDDAEGLSAVEVAPATLAQRKTGQ